MADSYQCMAKTTKYCKVISLQLIKINEKKKNMMGHILSGSYKMKHKMKAS